MFVVLVVGVYAIVYVGAAIAAAAIAACTAALLLFVCVYVLLPVAAIVLAVWFLTVVVVPWVILAGPVLYVGALPWRVNVPLFLASITALVLPLYVPDWPTLLAPTLGWLAYSAAPLAMVGLLHLLLLTPMLARVRECYPRLTRAVRPGAIAFSIALLIAPWSAFVILFFCMFMRDLWEPLGYAVWAFLCFGPMVFGVVVPIAALIMAEVACWH
jgi:hypothetical protein